MKDCIYSQDMYPYAVQTSTNCIIPMKGGRWDPGRDSHEYWKKASDIYAGNRGAGKNTPETLQKNLDHNCKLSKQLGIGKWLAVYNAGGENLCAMKVAPGRYIIEHGCFYVPCESEGEADYLTAMLNARIMSSPIGGAKTSDLYFGQGIWKAVPIPRFDPGNRLHAGLARAARRAGRVSERAYRSERGRGNRSGNWTISRIIREALARDGVSGVIDGLCRDAIDEHYRRVAGTEKSYWDQGA